MKKLMINLHCYLFLLAMIVVGGVSSLQACGFCHGHDSAANLLSSLNPPLSTDQEDQLKSILSTYGPTLKTLRLQFNAAKRQLDTLANATPVDQTAIQAQAQVVAGIEAQLAVQRAQASSAFRAVLTQEQAQQLTQQLMAKSESRIDAKIGYLLLHYARYLEKQ